MRYGGKRDLEYELEVSLLAPDQTTSKSEFGDSVSTGVHHARVPEDGHYPRWSSMTCEFCEM